MNEISIEEIRRLYNIAIHETLTPLVGIRGMADRLKRTSARGEINPRKLFEYMDSIHDYSEVAITSLQTFQFLINEDQYSDFDRIRQDVVFDLDYEIRKSIDNYNRIAESKEIEIIYKNLLEGHQKIRFDKFLFRIVVNNLIDNAIKYSSSNTEIIASLKYFPNGIKGAFISKGLEILESEKEKIFEFGYRGKEAMYTEASGRGLGLYVSNKILKKMGGKLEIDTIKNTKNTAVVFTVPSELIL